MRDKTKKSWGKKSFGFQEALSVCVKEIKPKRESTIKSPREDEFAYAKMIPTDNDIPEYTKLFPHMAKKVGEATFLSIQKISIQYPFSILERYSGTLYSSSYMSAISWETLWINLL